MKAKKIEESLNFERNKNVLDSMNIGNHFLVAKRNIKKILKEMDSLVASQVIHSEWDKQYKPGTIFVRSYKDPWINHYIENLTIDPNNTDRSDTIKKYLINLEENDKIMIKGAYSPHVVRAHPRYIIIYQFDLYTFKDWSYEVGNDHGFGLSNQKLFKSTDGILDYLMYLFGLGI
jgi:hypothetical protein